MCQGRLILVGKKGRRRFGGDGKNLGDGLLSGAQEYTYKYTYFSPIFI